MASDPRFEPAALFDLSKTAHQELFAPHEPAWAALTRIEPYLAAHVTGQDLDRARVSPRAEIGPHVILGEGTVVEPFATIQGPAWIGPGCTIRSGAYLRANVIAGAGVMMGNSCEFKNCLLFDHAEVPHFNYVGDSILGHKAHLGAGVILSNVRLDRKPVVVLADPERHPTGLRKFGAIVGDGSEIGCNAVLSPGSVIGMHCLLYPGSQWRGYLAPGHLAKVRLHQEVVRRDP